MRARQSWCLALVRPQTDVAVAVVDLPESSAPFENIVYAAFFLLVTLGIVRLRPKTCLGMGLTPNPWLIGS